MKRSILLALLFSSFSVFAQIPVKSVDQDLVDQELNREQVNVDPSSTVGEAVPTTRTPLNKKDITYTTVTIGETYYDLQSNASVGTRIVLHSDGSVSAVWTTSPDDNTGFPNRGSGYNHNAGSGFGSAVSTKLETAGRTGWPSIGILSTSSGDVEYVIGHESNTGGFIMSTNDMIGQPNWVSGSAVLDDETVVGINRVPIWNRTASNGKYVHLISNYWFSTENNVPRVDRDGVGSPMTYSRSADSGQTWDIQHILLPGYDSTLRLFGSADNYAIDVQDSVVAIVTGGVGEAVSLWRSNDNGDNWTYTDVDNFPYKGDAIYSMPQDPPVDANDGTLDVLIDNNGVVHVFYGYSSVLDDGDQGNETWFFRPTGAALLHWKEGDSEPVVIAGAPDLNGDDSLDVLAESWNTVDPNTGLNPNLLSATRTGSASLVTMPSAAIDGDGNIYCVYSSVMEGASNRHFLNASFRDVLVVYSTDGGATWSVPQNLTQTRQTEEMFACAAKRVDDYLHVIWQADETPGTNLQNHDPVSGTHPTVLNEIQYVAVPTVDILGDQIGQQTASVDPAQKEARVFVVSQNYPNPFENTTEVNIYLRAGSDLNLTVTDMAGKVVNVAELGFMNAGNHVITIDANELNSGIYFYTITSGDNSITKKMTVK